MNRRIIFVCDEQELEKVLSRAKQDPCPHCGRIGTLNRHDRLTGNAPNQHSGHSVRGKRLWCSNRGARGGCGRTTSLLFAWVLPRHTFTAPLLSSLLGKVAAGSSVKAAWEGLDTLLALESAYSLMRRFRERIDFLRSMLFSHAKPPRSATVDPVVQTIEHLQRSFPDNAVSAFQTTFAHPIMG